MQEQNNATINSNNGNNGNNGQQSVAQKKYCFNFVTASDIQQSEQVKRELLVDGIITPGLNLLAAPRKKGKSWLALDLALRIARGEKFMGRETKQGKVLYFALEDDFGRMRERINILLDYEDAPKDLLVSCATGYTGRGFYKDLNNFLEQNGGIKLVIVDVLQKIRSEKKTGQTEYAYDYDDIGNLKKIADAHGVPILAVTHTRKTKDSRDRLNEIAGGVGVTGAADTILMIGSNDAEKDNTLYITGRDVQETELTIHFDKDTCQWKYVGTTEEISLKRQEAIYAGSPIVKTIKALMKRNDGSWGGTITELLACGLRETGKQLAKSESALARKVNEFDELFAKDGITHTRPNPNGGSSGRKHYFVSASKAEEAPQSIAGEEELLVADAEWNTYNVAMEGLV